MNREITDMKFYGGKWMSFLPFGIFIFVTIYIVTLGVPDIRGMWVAALLGIMLTFFLSREKSNYYLVIIEGMADKIAIIPVVCWIFAGVFATVLKESGLVEGIIWAAYHTGVSGVTFVVITFFVSALFATITGTGFGTIIAGMAVLYPAGVLLGGDPVLLAGAIVSGGAFGDNLAPISDTTIASAASQGVDVGGVVKSRIKYVIPASIITLIAILMFGSGGSVQSVPYEKLSASMNPIGLVMIIPALLTIILAVKGAHLVSATTVGTIVGVITAHIFKLNSFSNVLYIQDGEVHGVFADGIAGMIDISVLALLLMAIVNIMRVGGGDKALIGLAEKVISTARGAEISIASLILAMCTIMGLNAPAILAIGLPYARPIAEKFNISPYRTANVLDALSCTVIYLLPWGSGLLLVQAGAFEANATFGNGVPLLTTAQVAPWVIYSWALLAVMIFAILTGWGRTMRENKTVAVARENQEGPLIKQTGE